MTKKLCIGDKVICRFYNAPEHKFYGQHWTAVIKDIDFKQIDAYLVEITIGDKSRILWINRKEIKRRV